MVKNCMFILKIKLKNIDLGGNRLEWIVGKQIGNEKSLRGVEIFLVKKWVDKIFWYKQSNW